MKRFWLALVFCAAFVPGVLVVPVEAATVNVANNRNNFGTGDTLSTALGATHSGAPVAVDAFLALVLPNQALIFFDSGLVPHLATADLDTWVKFVSDVTLPDGLNTGPIPIFNYMLTGIEPPGIYQWVFGLVSAGTLNVLDVKTASFFVGRTPVGPIIGNYEISSMIPSLGGSGTGVGTIEDGPPGTLTLTAQGFSAGFASSFTASGTLHEQGGMTWTVQGDLFGTTLQGTVEVGLAGGIAGTINVLAVGPFIESLTILGGSISDGVIQATDIVSYTDGTEGVETITATHQ